MSGQQHFLLLSFSILLILIYWFSSVMYSESHVKNNANLFTFYSFLIMEIMSHKCWSSDYLSPLLQAKVIPVNGVPCLTSFKKEEWVQNDIILFENLLNFRGENANCNDFSQKLASGAAIFVNDSFSLSHKIHASTVGITRFCYASLAGFHFEEELMQSLKINDTTRRHT